LPIFSILIAEGFIFLFSIRVKFKNIIMFLCLFILLLQPLLYGQQSLLYYYEYEEIRPVMREMESMRKQKDLVYVYYGAINPFNFYKKSIDFSDTKIIYGKSSRNDLNNYVEDIDNLKGNDRVWCIFSHDYKKNGISEKEYIIKYLNSIGKQEYKIDFTGAWAYLYDLSS